MLDNASKNLGPHQDQSRIKIIKIRQLFEKFWEEISLIENFCLTKACLLNYDGDRKQRELKKNYDF